MNKVRLCSATALRSLAIASLAALSATPALAQDTSAPVVTGSETTSDETIVVTGTRLARPNLESPVPVVTVTSDQLFNTGKTSIGDTLSRLPQLNSTVTQANSTNSLGTTGLNLLDLRGLGTQRTLVLVNGRRHVASDILLNAASPDINTIPQDLIESVDIVTGANSAVYGSDAIAGVVNFKLKRNYEGLQIRGQDGISKYGDDGEAFLSALGGFNFGDGRGNLTFSAEYSHHGSAYGSDRPSIARNGQWVTVDVDETSPSDGVFDTKFYNGVRYPYYNNGGDVVFCCKAGHVSDSNLFTYLFKPDGTLTPQTGYLTGSDLFDTRYIGGNGSTGREDKLLILQPIVNRYNFNVMGHYDFSDAFKPFFEAKYVRIDSRGSTAGPFFTGLGTLNDAREAFNTANPYLTTQARNTIFQLNGLNPATDDDFDFDFSRTVTDFGVRDEISRRQTYRFVAGIDGDLGNNWKYQVSGNYGEFRERTKVIGNVNLQRYLLAIDAVDEGKYLTGTANGNIVCRATIDPAARIAYGNADPAVAAATLANDVANCVPVNLFGAGNVSQAAKNYILQNTTARGKITQLDFNGYISGDTSKWFELPGGPIALSVGAEYRRETAYYKQDDIVTAGLTFYNSIPELNPPSFEVTEGFGEISAPILKDLPFIKELTISGAGRVSHYKGSTGTVYAYNGTVEWAPVSGIRFRGNYGRSVRAPNLVELYSKPGQNFAPGFEDPCSLNQIQTGTQYRAANCRAAGIPSDFNYQYTSSLQIVSGGNRDLKAEKSDSWTLGVVIQPKFIPGLTASIDYYNITVNDVITSPTAQQIANACYDLQNPDNTFCSLFQRAGAGGGPLGEEPYQILEGSLEQILLNYAKLKVRGLDIDVGYRRHFEGIGLFNTRFNWTHYLQNDQFFDPTNPKYANQLMYELPYPRDKFTWDVDFKTGPVTFGYTMRYIGKMVPNEYEDFFSVQGRPPQNPDAFPIHFYPAVFYHDIRTEVEVNKNYLFYLGIDNVTNRMPPYGLTGVGAGSGIYDNVGRFFYAGFKANF
ncbi:TonB-dependent receptor domain-containing protein [Flavisphingomonas formosensis]|uniref:TonB-dependent receptor domain-containing protein n=1 Tax=Flavisphingomonas formosensis TaxID=861534 RepID=UPI0012FCE91F|nr:TonB-dependent receptor [Sphingomonas formosensis]